MKTKELNKIFLKPLSDNQINLEKLADRINVVEAKISQFKKNKKINE